MADRFEVRNAADDALVGYFYLDMHPREGKYGHAACWGLQPACTLPGGARQLPISACVCNFTKPTEELPSLLKHSEVETFFHEFGHCMHGLCSSEPTFSRFAGTAVERDFVEAPSQMLENWCWDAGALARMSKHYKTGEPIPPALVKSPHDLTSIRAASPKDPTALCILLSRWRRSSPRRTPTRASSTSGSWSLGCSISASTAFPTLRGRMASRRSPRRWPSW